MAKHISYPKIHQFANVIRGITRKCTFMGYDETEKPIYDGSIEKPVLTCYGTVKLHGTNASICYNSDDGFWVQSRNQILRNSDNCGFKKFCDDNKVEMTEIINNIIEEHKIDTKLYTVSVYGEWAGKGVQKNVAISELEKAFYIFGVKITKPSDPEFVNYWLPYEKYRFKSDSIWNIYEFQTFEVEVDFNNPKLSQEKFYELTKMVGDECPVAKHFGVSGIGEGIVYKCDYKGETHTFKCKDERHAGESRVKKVKKGNSELETKLLKITNMVTPVWRLKQMFDKITNNSEDMSRKYIAGYIKLVLDDIVEEESVVLEENDVNLKQIRSYISNICRKYFIEQSKC